MLLHPCKCNNRFICTKPEDRRPKDATRINLLLHKQGYNNLFLVEAIRIQTHTNVYTV